MTLGEYIRQTREDRNLSLRKLSDKCFISSAEISRIESGKRLNPSPAALQAIAGALAIDYEYLLRLAGYMPENGQKSEKLPGALTDADGNLRDLYECAEEMYRTDKEWLQTAYQVSKELSEKDRKMIEELANHFIYLSNNKV